jgi:hypothetical protein
MHDDDHRYSGPRHLKQDGLHPMRDHATRRPIPVEQSVHWKPLNDPHYVVASLQPNDGGRRKIFVRQQTLNRLGAILRANGRRTVGLLVGHFYHCPQTGADYLAIESLVEGAAAHDEAEMEAVITEALAERSDHHRGAPGQIMGWYRGAATVESKPSPRTATIHTSLFAQPWQVTLVLGENNRGGALFLHDSVNSRWFLAPFYEMPDHAPTPNQPKTTVLNWPQYITAESVVHVEHEVTPVVELADVRSRKQYDRPALSRAPVAEQPASPAPTPRPAPGSIPLPLERLIAEDPPMRATPADTVPAAQMELEVPLPTPLPKPVPNVEPKQEGPLADRPAPTPVHEGIADLPRPTRDRPVSRRSGRLTEKLSIVDDRDQRTKVPSTGRPIAEDDDTSLGDQPSRYIDMARAEGFFIAAQFASVSQLTPAETLWVLNEPYSGLLLTVVTTATGVVDATLHYNLQTDDAGLQRTAFPAHRDPESKTIYVRETCLDSLRARCRRLRGTHALLREWKVTPDVSFLTPTEWEALPMLQGGLAATSGAIADVNNARIAELPDGIRSQFHLAEQPRP